MEERVTPRRREPQDAVASSGEDSDDGGFEFEFPSLLGREDGSPAPADDLFADGRIRPAAFYPVFGRRPSARANSAGDFDGGLAPAAAPPPTERRKRGQLGRLFLEESRAWNSSSSNSTGSTASTSSSAATDDGLEDAAPESYCVWTPGGGKPSESPRAGIKSGSTGSSVARWRRISDLVVGRSQSDGKEKFLFLPVNPPKQDAKPRPRPRPTPTPNPAAGGSKKGVAPASEIGTVAAAHRMAYGGGKAGVAPAGATPRRTFLPYREELVGFFASVNGISRSHAHPY